MRYITIAVTTKKPPHGTLSGLNRAEKVAMLKQNTSRRASELRQWLEDQHLRDQVRDVIYDSALGVLFMEATPEAKARIENAPNVTSVSEVEHIPVQLLHHRAARG
jgi:hypothetical protein